MTIEDAHLVSRVSGLAHRRTLGSRPLRLDSAAGHSPAGTVYGLTLQKMISYATLNLCSATLWQAGEVAPATL